MYHFCCAIRYYCLIQETWLFAEVIIFKKTTNWEYIYKWTKPVPDVQRSS